MVTGGYGRVAVGDVELRARRRPSEHDTHEVGLDADIRPMRKGQRPVLERLELAPCCLRPDRDAGIDHGDPSRDARPRRRRSSSTTRELIREGLTGPRGRPRRPSLHVRLCGASCRTRAIAAEAIRRARNAAGKKAQAGRTTLGDIMAHDGHRDRAPGLPHGQRQPRERQPRRAGGSATAPRSPGSTRRRPSRATSSRSRSATACSSAARTSRASDGGRRSVTINPATEEPLAAGRAGHCRPTWTRAVRAARPRSSRRVGHAARPRARQVPVPDRPHPPGASARVRRPRVDGLRQADQGVARRRRPARRGPLLVLRGLGGQARVRVPRPRRAAARRRRARSSRGTSRC